MAAAATMSRRASDAPGARRAARRDRARDRQLLVVLALVDVLLDGRPDDLPARVRLRLRLAGHDRRAATTTSTSSAPASSPPRSCSRARSRRCTGRSSSTSSSTPTTRSSPRRSTPRSSSPARRCGSPRAPASTAACRCSSAMVFGLDPSWGMLLVPLDRRAGRLRLGVLRDLHRGASRRRSRASPTGRAALLTPMFLVAGTFFPLDAAARVGAGRSATSTRCTTASQLVRHAVFGTWGWRTSATSAFLVGFALVSWRLAIRFMERKLIL